MKKIGISTVHTGYNYGSALQALATKLIITELGYKPVVVNLKGSLIKGRDVRVDKIIGIILKMVTNPRIIYKTLNTYRKSTKIVLSSQTIEKFNLFEKKLLSPKYKSWKQLKQLADREDYLSFVCGSDQIWNGDVLYPDPQYYLRYAPKHKRVAFAPSFGRDYVAKYNQKKIGKYISDIPCLSVREKTGVELIYKMTGRKALCLLDPTLVVNSEQWKTALHLNTFSAPKKRYILAYFLNTPSRYAQKFMMELSQKYNLEIVALPYEKREGEWYDSIASAGPVEFVGLVSNANIICTDSFHGTAFSINFNKPFYVFDRQYGSAASQSSRVTSLLSITHLSDRFNPEINKLSTTINFDLANSVLERERKKAKQYLISAFERNTYRG